MYLSVFSFIRKRRGFMILLRSLSLRILTSGWWSVATMRFGQPIMNVWHFWSDQATAVASPSMGAYLDSASVQNLLPAKTSFQPSWQHIGALSRGHLQCLCNKRNPIPSLLQSGARQVILLTSKVDMPSLTRLIITCFDWVKALSILSFNENTEFFFYKVPKGCHNRAEGKCPCYLID